MAIALTGNGGLFTRLGHLGGWQNDLFSLSGGTATTNISAGQLPARYAQVQADMAYSPVWTSLLDGYFASLVTSGQGQMAGLANQLAAIATNIIIQQANGDTPLLQQTLTYALQLLQTQMTGNYYITPASAAAGTITAVGSPVGLDSAILISTLRGDGLALEYIYPETLTFRCVSDQYSGATLNQEAFLVTGAAAAATNAFIWPGGSGASLRMNMVDCATNPGGTTTTGNCLTNSNFQVITNTNIPDNWISTGGPIGTNVFCGTTNPWRAPNALCFTGTGGTAASIYQAFATSPSTTLGAGGTPYVLTPRTTYGFNGWVRVSATPAAGVLRVRLTDGSGNTINNDNSVAQSFTQSLTGISTTYVNIQYAFQTPTVLPAAARLVVELSTDISSGKSAYMGGFALTPLTDIYQLTYPQGPQAALFSGNVPTALNDEYTSAITTGMALTTFGGLLEYILGIAQYAGVEAGLGIRLPSAGGTAVSDGLIA